MIRLELHDIHKRLKNIIIFCVSGRSDAIHAGVKQATLENGTRSTDEAASKPDDGVPVTIAAAGSITERAIRISDQSSEQRGLGIERFFVLLFFCLVVVDGGRRAWQWLGFR